MSDSQSSDQPQQSVDSFEKKDVKTDTTIQVNTGGDSSSSAAEAAKDKPLSPLTARQAEIDEQPQSPVSPVEEEIAAPSFAFLPRARINPPVSAGRPKPKPRP